MGGRLSGRFYRFKTVCMKWYQYLNIFGLKIKGKEYHSLLQNSNGVGRDLPPKDKKFFVYCYDREDFENDHEFSSTHNDKKYTKSIKGRNWETKWIGIAIWNEKNRMFDIKTTADGHENGFVSVPELEERMIWSFDLPLNLISS